MKFKIFSNIFPDELEEEVNDWLKDHPDITVVSSHFTETGDALRYTILYRKLPETRKIKLQAIEESQE